MPITAVALAAATGEAGAVGPVPATPTNVSAQAGNAQALVSYTPGSPATDTVTSFAATCTSSNGGAIGGGSTTGMSPNPIIVTGLTLGDQYTCTVIAVNSSDGNSAPSALSNTFIPALVPNAPTSVTAALPSSPGDKSLVVSFTDTDTVMFTATCSSSNGGTTGGPTAGTSPITVTGLTDGDLYTCAATATNGAGPSFPSAPSNSIKPSNAPTAPTGVTATPRNMSASVAFTDTDPTITGYAATCTSSNGGAMGGPTAGTSPITVPLLTNNDLYQCSVTATNGYGALNPSTAGVSSSFTPNPTVPDPPTNVVASQPPPVVATTWSIGFTPPVYDGGNGTLSYSVSCFSTDGGTPNTTTPASTMIPIVVTGLTAGNTYTCTVTATNGSGTSVHSAPSSPFVYPTVPRAPTTVTATAQSGGASVAFTPGGNGGSTPVTFYAQCGSSDGGNSFGTFQGTTSPIVVLNLTNGHTYTCTVRAQNAIGAGPPSDPSPSFVVSPIPGAPGPPTIGTAVAGSQSVNVSFTPGNPGQSPILGFTVTCTPTTGGAAVSGPGTAPPVFVSGLTNGVSYTCAATESNSFGNSIYSASTSAFLVGVIPDAPSSPSARPGSGAATVTWTAPANNGGAPITGYVVTPYLGSTAQSAHTFKTSATTEVVGGLINGRTYAFTVEAVNGIGAGPPSGQSTAVLIGTPSAPRAVAASPGLSSASVSWAPPASSNAGPITAYTVIPYANGAAKPAITFRSTARAQVVSHLAPGVTYVFRVEAVNRFGAGPMSSASQGVRVGVPTVPTGVQARRGPTDSLLVNFTASVDNGSKITKYTVVCTSSNGGTTETINTQAQLVEFKTPSRRKTYTCTVSATNARGTSPTSSPSNAVTVA